MITDRTEFASPENNTEQTAPNLAALLNQLDLPSRKSYAPTQAAVPETLPNFLALKPDLKATDWLPPSPISEAQLKKPAAHLVNSDAPHAVHPARAIDTSARDNVIKQLSPADQKELDLLRLQLCVSTGDHERQDKQLAVSSFLSSKLGDKVSESGLYALQTPPPADALLKEIKEARPAECTDLMAQTRASILTNAEHVITNAHKFKDFSDKLSEFDTRAAARGIPEAEKLSFYLQLGRVLDPSTKLEHGDKALLARSIMANAADPTSIDQGGHNTCNVTTLECRLFTQEPGSATKVITDVACGGKFIAADGTVVHPLNLDPDNEARLDPTPDGLRNYASQIWQLTAINSYWNRRETMPGGNTVGKGNIQYAQGTDGEYLLDVSVNPPQKQHFATLDSGHPWLDIYGVSEINKQLTGRPSKDLGIERWFYPSESEGVRKIVTLSGFKDHLVELKEAKAFPVIIEVDASKKPFGDGKGFGPHVVTITDYDATSGLVTVDNQWGKGADMTGLPGQGAKPSAEVLWSSMSQVPGLDFFYDKVKDGLKDVHVKDSIPPTITALSAKGMLWGTSAAAPLAVRGGLGYLGELGVPGAASLLSASETRFGGVALRAGTSLAALGAFAYINDLPAAFKQGNSYGTGKLTHIVGDWATFEFGAQATNKALSAVGVWAPIRIPVAFAAGMAGSAVFDRLMGESSEVAGSLVYDKVHDYIISHNPLSAAQEAPKPLPQIGHQQTHPAQQAAEQTHPAQQAAEQTHPAQQAAEQTHPAQQAAEQTMSSRILNRYLSYEDLRKAN